MQDIDAALRSLRIEGQPGHLILAGSLPARACHPPRFHNAWFGHDHPSPTDNVRALDSMDYHACGYASTAGAVAAIIDAIALIAALPGTERGPDLTVTGNAVEVLGLFRVKVKGSTVTPLLRLRIRFFLRHFHDMQEASLLSPHSSCTPSCSPPPAMQVLQTIDLPCYRYASHNGTFYTLDSAAQALSHRTAAVDWRTPPHR